MAGKRAGRLTRRTALITGAVVLVLAVGGAAWAATRTAPKAAATTRLVTAISGTIRQTIASTGTIEPAQQANLSFAVSGQVTAVQVAVGQRVVVGQPLATVNSAELTATLAQAQATLSSAESKAAADGSAGASSAQLAADQAAVTAADNQVANDQASLANATLTSPIAGVVAALNLNVGQQVSGAGTTGAGGGGAATAGGAATGSTTAASAQVVVISTSSYVVNATVDDTQVGQVKVGDQAVITPDGATKPVYGLVTSVGLIATSTSGVATYPMTIAVTGNPGGLYPGAGSSVVIIVEQLSNVVEVPTIALHFNAGAVFVNEIINGHLVKKPVTVGLASGGLSQITAGVAAGDQVVVPASRAGRRLRTGTGTGGGVGGRGLGGGGGGFPGGFPGGGG